MIRLQDQSVVVDLARIIKSGIQDFPVEVLAHEIGHHVFAPATLADHARMLARMRKALPTVEQHAPYIANLYTDLLINDRLQRSAGLRMADVYRRLVSTTRSGKVWTLYLRTYELLWSLSSGELSGQSKLPDAMEGDAWLAARLIRHFASDKLNGAGRFAALLLPYLLEDVSGAGLPMEWHDTRQAGQGGQPGGLTSVEAEEESGAVHPANDAELSGLNEEETQTTSVQEPPAEIAQQRGSTGQTRQPYEYGEILRAAGITLSDHEISVLYYKERASPHLIRFPSRPMPRATDPLPEGLEPWDVGDALDTVDWFHSVLVSPRVVPGVSTVKRTWGTNEGQSRRNVPVDLDLYVDSSGSMPNPQRFVSYLTLAGAILCLSALRAGARVKVTLWSGKRQVTTTTGFVRNTQAVLEVLTGFYGGGTQFPISELRDTYRQRPADAPLAHILIISDDGVSTMFDQDEQGNDGWQIARDALKGAGGGGTLLLNLPPDWQTNTGYLASAFASIRRARDEHWNVFRVATWEELVAFAREFGRQTYGSERGAGWMATA